MKMIEIQLVYFLSNGLMSFSASMPAGATIYIHVQDDEFYEGMGVHFVTVATDAGYGLMLQEL
jgi:hypothetical protein